ncbi:MAG: hypothetical protein SNJ75_12400 [Gemmataceae bacterium]
MASKKRDGGGSNLGLIITLVFFVLTTVILGVTTYLGFSELEAKEKIKRDAEAKLADRDKERNWWRFMAQVLQTYTGEGKIVGTTPAELALLKKQFDENTLPFSGEGKAEFAAVVKEFDKTMRWVGSDAPVATFKSLLAKKDADYAALGKQLAEAREQMAAEKERADKADAAAKAAKKTFDAQIAKLSEDSKKGLVDISSTVETLRAELTAANEAKNKAIQAMAGAQAEAERLKKAELVAKQEVENLRLKLSSLNLELNDIKDQLTVLKERTGLDKTQIEARLLDRNAIAALDAWRKDWQIVDIDRFGRNYMINLGSADGLRPQMTFSVHEKGRDGKLNPIPKGTIEVIEVRGPKLARARLSSVRNPAADPILKGDYLFNATWDPTRKKRVAIAGVVDLNDDHSNTTEEFLRLLRRQGVEIDAYIDTKGDSPKIQGDVTTRTDYLIMGDSLDQVNHPMARGSDGATFRRNYEKLQREMKEKANTYAVPVLSIRRYLEMIGYTPPATVARPER